MHTPFHWSSSKLPTHRKSNNVYARMLNNGDLSTQLNNLDLWPPPLLRLPSDVMVTVFEYLTVDALHRLSLVCTYLHDLVSKFGWASYLRSNPRFSWSLSCIDDIWSPFERVRYGHISERNWKNRNFVARPLSASWRGQLRPGLAMSRSRLVVAAGSNLDVYIYLIAPRYQDSPLLRREGTYSVNRSAGQPQVHHDITAIAFLPDNGEDRTLLVGFADGYLILLTLPDARANQPIFPLDFQTVHIGEDPIESISVSNRLSFSLSNSGKGILREATGRISSEIHVDEKSWSSLISSIGSPYVAIGTSSAMPLAIYPIHDSILESRPSMALSSIRASEAPGRSLASAVYGITSTPLSFPGNPGDIIVSGWFDGRVRIYDLRMPAISSFVTTAAKAIPLLSPVMTLSDPWNTESVYAVSTGGGSGNTVAAGLSRHSVVAFWDVRSPREGWSVHAPGNDQSPVYSVALESSRLFGATQSRPFVFDFGPGVGVETYPVLPRMQDLQPRNRRRSDGPLKTEDGLRFAVTKYLHRNPMASE